MLCGSKRDEVEVDFANPNGFLGFESDVKLIAADSCTTEVVLRLCCGVCSGASTTLSRRRVASSSRFGFFGIPFLWLVNASTQTQILQFLNAGRSDLRFLSFMVQPVIAPLFATQLPSWCFAVVERNIAVP
jgi:hypothetical protein